MVYRLESTIPRYEQIATDIAKKIASNDYQVGQKLSGRSLLAGTYNVSPETIRRSIALLQNIGIVEAVTGSGIIVKSAKLAQEYLTAVKERQQVMDLKKTISDLLDERRQLDMRLEKELFQLLDQAFMRTSLLQQIEEIRVPEDSWMVGKTIGELNLRHRTGATIVTVVKKGEEVFSPPMDLVLDKEDLIIIVGPSNAKEQARKFLLEIPPQI